MFDLFRSRDKAVRILLGAILGIVALSMVTYLIPGSGMGGTGSTDSNIVANIGEYTVTAQDAQRVISNVMRGRNLPPEILTMYAPQMINNLIGQRAMAYEAKRLGFQATEADTAESGAAPSRRRSSRTANSSARNSTHRCWVNRV